ncbi:MAG: succinylglutamate desuccinylase/aspartoacylase family protein [Lautropia sp.]
MTLRPIELNAPDIARWKAGNTGTGYVWSWDSGRPGPQVMVQALTHGNEICGAIALDWLLDLMHGTAPGTVPLRPAAGRLTLAFANVDAYARWDPADPDRSRYVDEDYNRVWADDALLGSRDSVELRRARALRPFVDAADLLLDIHSMHDACRPIMVCGASGRGGEKSAAYARRLGVPADLLIDTGHPAGLRMIERGPFGDPGDARTAILIECGQHWERSAALVAKDTMLRFLRVTGSFDAATIDPLLAGVGLSPAPRQQVIRVTEAVVAHSLDFRFARAFAGLEVVPRKGDLIAHDGDTLVRAPYDDTVLVMPSMAHLKIGTTMVRLGRIER